MKVQLRTYQQEAVDSVIGHIRSSVSSCMIILPTGCHAKGPFGPFFIKTEYHHQNPSAAHYLLVGFVVLVAAVVSEVVGI
jgi:hypothetical protein